MAEKLEGGLFWLTHNSLQSDCEKEKFHQFWGHAFENYVNWLIQTSVNSIKNEFHPFPKFIGEKNQEVCDGIIISGSNLILLEYKGRTFTAKAKYSQNIEALSQELEKHLIGNDQHRKGVYQLAQSVRKLFNKENPSGIEGIDISNIKKIYPVLITRDVLGSCFYLNTYIKKKTNHLFKKNIPSGITITPVFCISIEEFETMVAYFPFLSLSDLLHGWYQKDKNLRFSFLALEDKNPSISPIGFKRNNFLNQIFNETWDQANNELFSN